MPWGLSGSLSPGCRAAASTPAHARGGCLSESLGSRSCLRPVRLICRRRNWTEAFRQGSRGPAHDLTLEARPWGVPLDKIQVAIEIWRGDGDRAVSPHQSRILADALPLARTHFVPGEGHLLLAGNYAKDILQSVING